MNPLAEQLKVVLANTFALYLKTHNFHWNVEGPDFPQLHHLFENQYREMQEAIDDIAEKIRMLDAYAPGSFERFQQLSLIKSELKVPAAADMLRRLIGDHELMTTVLNNAFSAAENVDNQAIMNFLAERLDAHAKHRWMLVATGKNARV